MFLRSSFVSVRPEDGPFPSSSDNLSLSPSGHSLHPGLASPSAGLRRGRQGARGPIGGPGGEFYQQGAWWGGHARPHRGGAERVAVSWPLPGTPERGRGSKHVLPHTHSGFQTFNSKHTFVSDDAGDGETAGSHGNRPLPPLLPSPDASGSVGPPPTDPPPSSRPLHLCLLLRGPAGAPSSQPRPPAASLQTQPVRPPPHPAAGPLQLHISGGRGGHAAPDPTKRPRLFSAGLPLLLSPPTSTAALRLAHGSSPSPPLRLPRRTSGLLGPLLSSNSSSSSSCAPSQATSHPSRLAAPGASSSYSSSPLLDPLSFREGRGLSSLIDSSQSSAPAPLPERPAFLERCVRDIKHCLTSISLHVRIETSLKRNEQLFPTQHPNTTYHITTQSHKSYTSSFLICDFLWSDTEQPTWWQSNPWCSSSSSRAEPNLIPLITTTTGGPQLPACNRSRASHR